MFANLIGRFGKSGFFKDSFWALIGSVAVRGSSLISAIFLAHILQKSAYGEFNSLKNTLTTLAVFTTFGLGYTSTKFVADTLSKTNGDVSQVIRKIYLIAVSFSTLIAALLFVFAKEVSVFYYKDPGFHAEIRILAPWIILMAVTTAQNGIIAGLKVFKKLAVINVITAVLTLSVVPLFAYYHHLMGACVSLVVIQSANTAMNYKLIRQSISISSKKIDFNIPFRAILIYSLPLTLIEAVYSTGLWINYYLIQTHFNYGEVALYSTAMQWYILLLFIPMILRNVILSHFSSYSENTEISIFRNATLLSFVSTLGPMILILAVAPFIEMLYGRNFTGLTEVLRVAAVIPLFASIMGVFEQYMFSKSKNWTVFLVSFIKDGGTCVLFFWFIMQTHIRDAAFYLLLSYLILNIFAFLIYTLVFMKTNKVFRNAHVL